MSSARVRSKASLLPPLAPPEKPLRSSFKTSKSHDLFASVISQTSSGGPDAAHAKAPLILFVLAGLLAGLLGWLQ